MKKEKISFRRTKDHKAGIAIAIAFFLVLVSMSAWGTVTLTESGGTLFVDGSIDVTGSFIGTAGSSAPVLTRIRNSNNNSWTATATNWQSAMDDAPGGTVWLPNGTIEVTSDINWVEGVAVLGVGYGTHLDFTSSADINIADVDHVELGNLRITGSFEIDIDATSEMEDIYFHNLWLLDQDVGGNGAIQIMVSDTTLRTVRLDHVIVENTAAHGFAYSGGAELDNGILDGLFISNSRFTRCGDGTGSFTVGIDLREHGFLRNALLENVLVERSWESNFYMEALQHTYIGLVENVVLSNCVSRDAGRKPGFTYGAGFLISDNVSLSNCDAFNNGGAGISVWGNHTSIIGGIINGNGTSEEGILIESTACHNITISEVEIINNGDEGIFCYGGIDDFIISENRICNNGLQGIYMADNTREGFGSITDNDVVGNAHYGIDVEVTASSINNNRVSLHKYSGIRLNADSDNCSANDNICFNNGYTSEANGIKVDGDNHTINDNHCFDDIGVQDYGIAWVGTPNCILYDGNHLNGNANSATTGSLGEACVTGDNLT